MTVPPPTAPTIQEAAVPVDRPSRAELDVLLAAATSAPSLHNSQPWRFAVDDGHIDLHADPGRQLRQVDPDGRGLHVSCGAALLNLRVAAEHLGHAAHVRLLPEPGAPTLLARVTLSGRSDRAGMTGAMFDAIPERHTNRFPFEDRQVPYSVTTALVEASAVEGAELTLITDESERRRLTELVHLADLERDLDPRLSDEAAEWTGVSEDRADGVPGYALGPLPRDPGVPVRDLRRGHPVNGRPVQRFEKAPLLGVLSTSRDDREAWLRAGQALERVLLVATIQGLAASFVNQPLEHSDLRFLVRDPQRGIGYPQMVLRLGYGVPTPPTPRRPLDDVTVES